MVSEYSNKKKGRWIWVINYYNYQISSIKGMLEFSKSNVYSITNITLIHPHVLWILWMRHRYLQTNFTVFSRGSLSLCVMQVLSGYHYIFLLYCVCTSTDAAVVILLLQKYFKIHDFLIGLTFYGSNKCFFFRKPMTYPWSAYCLHN